MAMNLRLAPQAAEAVRREAQRTGRTQQDVVRDAISLHLDLPGKDGCGGAVRALVSAGSVRPPRMPYRKVAKRLTLPPGVTGAVLLDRNERA